jgi:hypothetical protein
MIVFKFFSGLALDEEKELYGREVRVDAVEKVSRVGLVRLLHAQPLFPLRFPSPFVTSSPRKTRMRREMKDFQMKAMGLPQGMIPSLHQLQMTSPHQVVGEMTCWMTSRRSLTIGTSPPLPSLA